MNTEINETTNSNIILDGNDVVKTYPNDGDVMVIPVSQVKFRGDLYPRMEHNQAKAQEYSENIENLPPIWVNQHYELIDGNHRRIAHQLAKCETITVEIHHTTSDAHLLELAIKTNATHGLQMSQADKKKMAIKLYAAGERGADRKKALANLLAVTVRSLTEWVKDLDQAERDARKAKIKAMYFQCYTAEEIGDAVGLTRQALEKDVLTQLLEDVPKVAKVQFLDDEFQLPIYNIWSFAKKTNKTSHFGNTEQRIVENLLWLYTQPLDIVIDPFGGGGSTLDVCNERGRRCWISDRKPKPGLEEKLRTLDITSELPQLNKRWADVALVYLDPPYWWQAKGQYSDDAEDLANTPTADDFHAKMSKVVKAFSAKLKAGARIALIIQPTQWKSPDRQFTDHVIAIINAVGNKKLIVENRVSCPYSTEQCNPQMVDWAKENKQLLVLTRELIIWRVVE
ncbi:ParB N-terminal domain-containing protein [Rhodoferax sp. 4810]|uniref:ParB N-terminal domain-containing protein n=1 Tax=Thiospirillum jenense TaxID=1653858 RepID=A0A839H8W2_9GAMM|nr:DNA methyltransferase [Thiospirillum jenense]MBB1074495.1 ParB N-terminal domain-containing protein [Rhodoferax jenense]MBB1125521.1 ParB N-terminal domain-containing protein [Thiospirillum jenense]